MALFGRIKDGAAGECREVKIRNLEPGLKSFILEGIVLEKDIIRLNASKSNLICEFLIADDSGSCILTLFDDYVELINPGDIIRVERAYSTLYKNQLQVFTGKKGLCKVIGSMQMKYNEFPNLSSISWVQDGTAKSGWKPLWNKPLEFSKKPSLV